MRKLFASALAVAALATATPVFAFDADARATAFRADQLAQSSYALADSASAHGRVIIANKAEQLAGDAGSLADAAYRASRGPRGQQEIRSRFILVRGSFQDLRDRWLEIRGGVRDANLRYAYQGVQAAWQNLRQEVRD